MEREEEKDMSECEINEIIIKLNCLMNAIEVDAYLCAEDTKCADLKYVKALKYGIDCIVRERRRKT